MTTEDMDLVVAMLSRWYDKLEAQRAAAKNNVLPVGFDKTSGSIVSLSA